MGVRPQLKRCSNQKFILYFEVYVSQNFTRQLSFYQYLFWDCQSLSPVFRKYEIFLSCAFVLLAGHVPHLNGMLGVRCNIFRYKSVKKQKINKVMAIFTVL